MGKKNVIEEVVDKVVDNLFGEDALASVEGEEDFIEVVGDTEEVYEESEGDVE